LPLAFTPAFLPTVSYHRPIALAWGSRPNVKTVRRQIGSEINDRAVAAYVAKYASKGTEDIGGIPAASPPPPT
jgi:hypothetical protein